MQRARPLGQMRAAALASAMPGARHHYLAALRLTQAHAHRLAAAFSKAGASPDPRIQAASAQLVRLLGGLRGLELSRPGLGEGEADLAFDPTGKKARRNRQEAIRVDRLRTDRARMRSEGAESRRRRRRLAAAQLRPAVVRAVDLALTRALVVSPRLTPPILQRFRMLIVSAILPQAAALLADYDGSTPFPVAVLAATAASAVASVATELGIVDAVNVESLSKAIYQILASELPPAIKVMATGAAIATHRKPGGSREAEAFMEQAL